MSNIEGSTYGYVQFWVPGEEGPVLSMSYRSTRDEHNNPVMVSPNRHWWGSPRSDEDKITEARELCLKYKKLGFSLHDNAGNQIRELELTNIWSEDLSTNGTR